MKDPIFDSVNDALKLKLALLEHWSEKGREWCRDEYGEKINSVYNPETISVVEQVATSMTPRQLTVAIMKDLRIAEAYYVNDPIKALIATAGRSLPLDSYLSRDGMPPDGFVLFASPMQFQWDLDGLGEGSTVDFIAFHFAYKRHSDSIMFWWYEWRFERIYPFAAVCWEFRTSLRDFEDGDVDNPDEPKDPDHKRFTSLRQFCISFFAFLRQKLLIPESHPAARKTVKRLQGSKHPMMNTTIKVVVLRKALRAGRHDPANIEVDWQCRWFVKGHWRQQYYPSTNSNSPIWIIPYIKGPEDKPLKQPDEQIFAVVR